MKLSFRLLNQVPLLVLSVLLAADDCEAQVTWLENPQNGNWYAMTSPLSWPDAELQAEGWGGYLTAVRNQSENDWLLSNLAQGESVWIGYTDQAQEGVFSWVSGDSVSFELWASGQPDDFLGADWAVLDDTSGLWLDEPYLPQRPGVVELVSDDCDGNGVPDVWELAQGTASDCNGNGILDVCDVINGTSTDCDGNGRPDECDLIDDPGLDCNGNGILDVCDVINGTSTDCNGNGIPDGCDSIGVSICPGVPSSSGQPAVLTVSGCRENGVPTELTLTVTGLPTIKRGLFMMSAPEGHRLKHLGLQGEWCVGRPIILGTASAGTTGTAQLTLDMTVPFLGGSVSVGEVRKFQFLYSDQLNNWAPYVSNAVSLDFLGGPFPIYKPTNNDIPVPNDWLFGDTTDLTLSIPVVDPSDGSDPLVAMNGQDGWSVGAPFPVAFSGAIDLASAI
ncbi:MAG TPA: hypothetical protein EYQ74_11425, partial [Planctomycetes bacterium]|nr:hypothetical protein [Planctomycetota bacterium]